VKRLPPERESQYPNLRSNGYWVSSKTTENELVKYNCVALAACDDLTVWWEPSTMNSKSVIRPGRYWPLELTDDFLSTYCKLFESLGYRQCPNARLELLYEKIALYGDSDDCFLHVAYQLYFGWISKMGDRHDITHRTLKALENDEYGKAKIFMKKRCDIRGYLSRAFFNWTSRNWPVNRRNIQHFS